VERLFESILTCIIIMVVIRLLYRHKTDFSSLGGWNINIISVSEINLFIVISVPFKSSIFQSCQGSQHPPLLPVTVNPSFCPPRSTFHMYSLLIFIQCACPVGRRFKLAVSIKYTQPLEMKVLS